LAAGFLTGKATAGKADGTRFSDDHPLGKVFLEIFKTNETDAAVKKLDQAAQKAGIPVHEAALRWLFYHSALSENDGVILGASNISQLQANLASVDKGPLEAGLVKVFEQIWADLEEKRGSII
jgi:aflatoxin B1 aldehyde reductase